MPTAQEDIIYYRRRIDVVLVQAAQATCPSARHAYEELMRLYHELLDGLERSGTRQLSPAGTPAPLVDGQGNADDIHSA